MAQQLYFSRDTRMFIQFRNGTDNSEAAANLGKGALFEIPILDGYSFSQTTNTSEITLAEMESTAGISRRGRRVFTDSLAPAEWSFSSYVRPFNSLGSNVATGIKSADGTGTDVHAVEEVLFASMFGADNYNAGTATFTRAANPAVSGGAVITPAATSSEIKISESNRSALHSFVIYFLIDTAEDNPVVYRLPEAIVNEVSMDFDVDGIATLNWSGFAKEIQDVSGGVATATSAPAYNATTKDGTAIALGDIFIDTDNVNGRAFHIVNTVPSNSGTVSVTQAIDEATTSTKNFIRNRLTSVEIEAAVATDKIASIFGGSHGSISAIDIANDTLTSNGIHNLKTGDQVFITGGTGNTSLNGTHHFVRVGDESNSYNGTGSPTTKFTLFDTKANAEDTTSTTGKVTIASGAYDANTYKFGNGKYSLVLTGGSFTIANGITFLVPEELGAINKPLEHVTGVRSATGNATCYLTLEDGDITSGTSRQFFNNLVSTSAMSKVVNKFKVTMFVGGKAAAENNTDPALEVKFPTAHIEVPSHQIEDVISLETNFQALPTDFGTADEITHIKYYPVDTYS